MATARMGWIRMEIILFHCWLSEKKVALLQRRTEISLNINIYRGSA